MRFYMSYFEVPIGVNFTHYVHGVRAVKRVTSLLGRYLGLSIFRNKHNEARRDKRTVKPDRR